MEKKIAVGDVIYNSWGWEQTNVDFYKVVRATEKSVWVKKMPASIRSSEGLSSMAGYAEPIDEIVGDEIGPLRINKWGCVSVSKYGGTGIYDGKPKYCSWYG